VRAKLGWGRSLAAGPILLICSAAWSQEPGASGERWDDRHMRSNFARYLEGAPAPRVIIGSDRFHQLADGSAPEPAREVPETTLSISAHEWQPGGPSGGAGATGLFPERRSGFSAADGARASRSSGVRPASHRGRYTR
jgi:hypothetical protein